jgi:hypothetical protein
VSDKTYLSDPDEPWDAGHGAEPIGGSEGPKEMIHDVPTSTPKGRLYTHHVRLCHDALELMAKKNHDYASIEDPYRNFRQFGRFGILVRLGDKFARLRSFEEQGELKVQDESIRDTLLDIINYAVLYYGYED